MGWGMGDRQEYSGPSSGADYSLPGSSGLANTIPWGSSFQNTDLHPPRRVGGKPQSLKKCEGSVEILEARVNAGEDVGHVCFGNLAARAKWPGFSISKEYSRFLRLRLAGDQNCRESPAPCKSLAGTCLQTLQTFGHFWMG